MRLALLAAFLALPLMACEATRSANAVLEAESSQLEMARLDLMRTQIMGESEEKIAAAKEVFETEIEDVKAAARAQVAAAKADLEHDLETAVRTGASALGMGPWADLIAMGVTTAVGVWVARDRRKRMGGDPLQREDIPTPPVTAAVIVEEPK